MAHLFLIILTTYNLLPLIEQISALRCYHCPPPAHDFRTCEKYATILTCQTEADRCYYQLENVNKNCVITTTTLRPTTTTSNATVIVGNTADIAYADGDTNEPKSFFQRIFGIGRRRKRQQQDTMHVIFCSKVIQGCARGGIFPCNGSAGLAATDDIYCRGDLSYGNCIGKQCNTPGLLMTGNMENCLLSTILLLQNFLF